MATVLDRVKQLIIDGYGVDEASAGDRSKKFQEDLDLDELDIVELIMACEEEFCIGITDDEADHAPTIGDLVDLIEKKIAAK